MEQHLLLEADLKIQVKNIDLRVLASGKRVQFLIPSIRDARALGRQFRSSVIPNIFFEKVNSFAEKEEIDLWIDVGWLPQFRIGPQKGLLTRILVRIAGIPL